MSNANIRVLVIDDLESLRKLIRPILTQQLGFLDDNITQIHDARKALAFLRTEKIDLVLCEWEIPPQTTGLHVLKTIRKDPKLKNLPFIMVTSESDQGKILQAAQAQVSQYVVKPFTADSFSVKLNQALKSNERPQAKRSPATSANEVKVMIKGQPCTSGSIVSISPGGMMAKLVVHRGLTVYDKLDLKIQCANPSTGDTLVNSVFGELARIERDLENKARTTGNYAFTFLQMDPTQKKFVETIIGWLK